MKDQNFNYWTNWNMKIITPKNQEWRKQKLIQFEPIKKNYLSSVIWVIILSVAIITIISYSFRLLALRQTTEMSHSEAIGVVMVKSPQSEVQEGKLRQITAYDNKRESPLPKGYGSMSALCF